MLLRVVVDPGAVGSSADEVRLVPDPRRRLQGRGAWLHPDVRCLELAVRRRAFGRALRVEGRLGADAVAAWLTAHPAGASIQKTVTHPG